MGANLILQVSVNVLIANTFDWRLLLESWSV